MKIEIVESKLNYVRHVCEKLNENLVYPLNIFMSEIRLDFNNEIMENNGKPYYYVICPHCRIFFAKEIK